MKVRPILVENCYSCHAAMRRGGLRLDSREALIQGGDSGPVIVPGKPEQSLLIQAVRRTNSRLQMPPAQKLNEAEIAALVEWVATGAVWPASGGELFEGKVQPIFSKNCYACHTTLKSGGLRLDSRADAFQGGVDGVVIVPGKPDESLLIQAVRRTHARIKMPPTEKLSDAEIATLADWVRKGAIWPEQPTEATTPASGPI